MFEILDTPPDVADRSGVARPGGKLRGDVAARAHEFIVELPEKYDAWIGKRRVLSSAEAVRELPLHRFSPTRPFS